MPVDEILKFLIQRAEQTEIAASTIPRMLLICNYTVKDKNLIFI
jgi:hypothetical protein